MSLLKSMAQRNQLELKMYQKINHPDGDDYENWLAAEQAEYYKEVIA